MKIRKTLSRVYIIRDERVSTNYEDYEKTKSQIIGSFPFSYARQGIVPEELSIGKCKEKTLPIHEIIKGSEIDLLRDYVQQEKIKHDEMSLAVEIATLSSRIRRVSDNLHTDEPPDEYAQELFLAIDSLDKSLHDLGFKRYESDPT